MQIVDLRQLHSRSLEGLFREEAERWRDELQWDYRPSIDLVRKFIDSRALGGYAAVEDGRPAGYGFYVLEDHKGLIGGLFELSSIPRFSRSTFVCTLASSCCCQLIKQSSRINRLPWDCESSPGPIEHSNPPRG